MRLEDFCLCSGTLKWEDLNYTVNISNNALKFHGQSSSSFFWCMTKGCSFFCFWQTENRLGWQMAISYCKPDSCITLPASAGKQAETTVKPLQEHRALSARSISRQTGYSSASHLYQEASPSPASHFSPCYAVEALLAVTVSIIPESCPVPSQTNIAQKYVSLLSLKKILPVSGVGGNRKVQWHSRKALICALQKGCLHANVTKSW